MAPLVHHGLRERGFQGRPAQGRELALDDVREGGVGEAAPGLLTLDGRRRPPRGWAKPTARIFVESSTVCTTVSPGRTKISTAPDGSQPRLREQALPGLDHREHRHDRLVGRIVRQLRGRGAGGTG
ncbi:hypothetical protein [Streptomyces sp. NBC_01614]|uniref:hypothetical protein n=1 Tax=Streptomyces sp. NBC_01614 TaxID=2975897 RepID=UPI00386EA450